MKSILFTFLFTFSFSSNAGMANEMYVQDLEYEIEYLEQKIDNQSPQENEEPQPFEDEELQQEFEYDRKMLNYYQQRLQQVR